MTLQDKCKVCDECGTKLIIEETYAYCPKCGWDVY